MKKTLCSIGALILLSVGTFAQEAAPKQDRNKSQDEVIAAVVRYATLSRTGVVFVRVGGQDPSSETLRQLSMLYVRILPASRTLYVPIPNQAGYWKDKKTGEIGSYFEAEISKRVSDTRIEVSAGWWQPCGTYIVVFHRGGWSVDSYKPWEFCF